MEEASADSGIDQLLSDGAIQPLLEESFDAKSFATNIIQYQMVGETLLKLANGIAALDKELYSQVVTNYEDLLSQATGIEALESVLKMMQTRIDSLRLAVDRIGSKIVDPYQKIVVRTAQLARLQVTCDLLRRVIRMLYLMRRLRSQLQGGSREITKVAQTFSEIDQLTQSSDLNGVQVLEEERVWLARTRKEVESQAKRMMVQGLELMNPAQVGVALQVFHYLGQLPPTLLSVLGGFRNAIQHDIQNALDPATLVQGGDAPSGGPGRSTLPMLGSSASWKASLWTRLESLANSIQKAYNQVHQLLVVLAKKKDPISQVTFLEAIDGSDAHNLLTHFWESITENLALEFAAAAKASTFLNQVFEADYPKLVRVFSGLLSRIEEFSVAEKPSGYLPSPLDAAALQREATSSPFESALLKALSPFEKAYISRSLSRLFDSVNQLFGPGARGLPSEEDLHGTIKTMSSELSVSGGCGPLSTIVARNVEKTVKLFNMKCEQMVSMGRDSLQISGAPNSAQLRNIAVVNSLFAFNKLITGHIVSLSAISQRARTTIMDALDSTVTQMESVVSLFVDEVQGTLELMVASMHAEDFRGVVMKESTGSDAPCSGYMREMQSFIARIHTQHLSKYHCEEELEKILHHVTVRVIELFVRHVCLLRPLEQGGKMRITTDMAQIELALAPFCSRLADLGLTYKMLRSIRRLLFLAAENMLTEECAIWDTLPYSCALSHLFSRAPHEMKSPHKLQGWSEKEYSDWMDKHLLEKDRLVFIQATLDTYAKQIRSQGQQQYASIYPIMSELLKRGLQACSS